MKALSLIYLLLAAHFYSFAQSDGEPSIEQRPYNYSAYFQKKKGHGIKKEVMLLTKPDDAWLTDTSNVEEFDENGNLIRRIMYGRSGKRFSLTDFTTSKDEMVKTWKMRRIPANYGTSVNTTHYLANGKIDWFKNIDISSNGDTTLRSVVKFTYDSLRRVLSKTDQINGKTTLTRTYEYSGNDMVRYFTKVANSASVISFEYSYDSLHLPLTKKQIITGPAGPSVFQTMNFNYQNGRLLSERYTSTEVDRKDVDVTYSYDTEGKISSFHVKMDTLFRNVSFEFEGDHLKRIKANGNALNSFHRELLLLGPISVKNVPFAFRREYEYDSRGNLIKEVDFYDEQEYLRKEYQLTYW